MSRYWLTEAMHKLPPSVTRIAETDQLLQNDLYQPSADAWQPRDSHALKTMGDFSKPSRHFESRRRILQADQFRKMIGDPALSVADEVRLNFVATMLQSYSNRPVLSVKCKTQVVWPVKSQTGIALSHGQQEER